MARDSTQQPAEQMSRLAPPAPAAAGPAAGGVDLLRPRWQKVLRDLWLNKTRTILVVLSIAVGVFAFGTIVIARENVLRELRTSYLATNPASAILSTDSTFDDELVDAVRRVPGVGAAEGRRKVAARILIGPDTWYDLELYVIPDDGITTINIVQSESGAWPPPDKALLIERSSLRKIYAQVGDQVTIEMAGGEQRTLPIVGLTHDLSLPPAPIAGKAFGYISFDTLEWLGGKRDYNEMKLVVAEHPLDEEHIWDVAALASDKIERSGREVEVIDVPTPQQHPAEIIIPTILLILSGLGLLALLLSMFLIINTIESILTQQIRQIGMLKAIGARNGQIVRLYAGMVLAFGLMALLLAVPLGALGARGFMQFMTSQLNVDVAHFTIPLYVLLLKSAAALLLPMLVALPAIRSAVRITVREALDTSGLEVTPTRHTFIDRLVERIRGVPRPLLLSLRNTFRRKWRLIRTLAVLTLGGAIFISVLTVRASLYYTLDNTMATKGYDIELQLARPYRRAEVVPKVLQVPGVVDAEGWSRTTAYPQHADGSEGERITLYAVPASTRLLNLPIREGRWLLPEDRQAIVVTLNYLTKEPATRLGDSIVLKIDGEEYSWHIVGISYEFISPVNPAIGYVNYNGFAQTVGGMGEVDSLQVVTAQHDADFQQRMSRALEEQTERDNLQVRLIKSKYDEQVTLYERFNILTGVLSMMATLIGIVGGLGLMGTMSINVIERIKEIGIMRAIGASDGAIQQIVIAEGIVIGLLSWCSGTILSLPISRLMSRQLGIQLLNQPLSYNYALYAVGLWLIIVLVVATLASYVPARNASRITVREVLAYE